MLSIHKNIVINSTVLFVIAVIIETILHESGHFFAYIMVHAGQISLHHNYVSSISEGLPVISIIFAKAAGPFVSLSVGLIFHYICSHLKERNFWYLFYLYMSVFGYIGFLGYLMISPFFQNGDTGYIFFLLEFPFWLKMTIGILAGIILYFIMRMLMKYFAEMGSAEIMDNKSLRFPFIHSLILYPAIIGIIISTLLSLPVPVYLSLIASVCSPLAILWAYNTALEKKYPVNNANSNFEDFNKINLWLFIPFIIVVIINRLLVYGIYAN